LTCYDEGVNRHIALVTAILTFIAGSGCHEQSPAQVTMAKAVPYVSSTKATINAQGEQLVLAIVFHREEEALGLIERGVDVNYRPECDDFRSTSLYYAAGSIYDMSRVIDALVKHGADVNASCIGGFTPLHNACYTGTFASVEYLIAHGAIVKAKDKFGWTPLHVVCSGSWVTPEDRRNLITLLLAHGADVNAENNEGSTPLDWAIENHNVDAVPILQRAGGKSGHAHQRSTANGDTPTR
jgi:hypothetical protein